MQDIDFEFQDGTNNKKWKSKISRILQGGEDHQNKKHLFGNTTKLSTCRQVVGGRREMSRATMKSLTLLPTQTMMLMGKK